MAPPSEHATSLAARLDGAVALELAVVESFDLADGVCELTLEGDLTGFAPWPGQDVMVSVPASDAAGRWRRYTVRRIDPAASTLDLWVTLDTSGPGAAWASTAKAGDRVEAVGPRGKISLDETAATHLFVVDLAGAAAMCAMAEAVPKPALIATLAVTGAEYKGVAQTSTALRPEVKKGVRLRHHLIQVDPTVRLDRTLDASTQLLDERPIAAYVFGELSFTREVVALLSHCGIESARITSKPYWRKDRANESNGEPMRAEPLDSE